MKVLSILLLVAMISKGHSVIIPDELPSILSLIYSNIPTLKKGTDSRIGWGFRLGDRADFQVLVELGPQQNTQPLANQGDSGTNKRHAPNSFANALYAQAQRYKEKNTISNTDGGKFIDQWSKDMNQNQQQQQPVVIDGLFSSEEPSGVDLGVGEIDARDVIPDESVSKLEELYGKTPMPRTTTIRPKTTTSYKDALDNVDLL